MCVCERKREREKERERERERESCVVENVGQTFCGLLVPPTYVATCTTIDYEYSKVWNANPYLV